MQPNAGTLIAEPGLRTDLTDDPCCAVGAAAAGICHLPDTRYHLRLGVNFRHSRDRAGTFHRPAVAGRRRMGHAVTVLGYMRFCRIELDASVDIESSRIGEQIGHDLWRLLDRGHSHGVPLDFVVRHLLLEPRSVVVWNRYGVAVAYQQGTERIPAFLEHGIRRTASLSREFKAWPKRRPKERITHCC